MLEKLRYRLWSRLCKSPKVCNSNAYSLVIQGYLRSLERAGFDNRFRILFGRKNWALVLVRQKGEKNAHSDGGEG